MNNYAYLIKAKAKAADAKNLFCWFQAKSDSRAERDIANILEDADIETGRGADYLQPVRTNWLIVDDLPEERALDATWCDRYELAEDGITWKKIASAVTENNKENGGKSAGYVTTDTPVPPADVIPAPQLEPVTETSHPIVEGGSDIASDDDENTEYPVVRLRLPQRIIAQYLSDKLRHHVTQSQRIEIGAMEMDCDNSHVQNLLLAARSLPGVDNLTTNELWKLTSAIKSVFPEEKRYELAVMVQFIQAWSNTHHIDRGILIREWAAGKRVAAIQRTDTGANAGGGNETDRNGSYVHTLETLDVEIAAATLPMDFDIYNIPVSVHRRAKDIVAKKESPFKEWSAALRKTPGILDFSRAAIFALIRSANEDVHNFPVSLQTYINANLTENQHDKPTAETIAAARQIDSAAVVAGVIHGTEPAECLDKLATEFAVVGKAVAEATHSPASEMNEQPEVKRLGDGMYSIDGLIGNTAHTPTLETANNVQMEKAVSDETPAAAEVPESQTADVSNKSRASAGESTDTLINDTVHQNDELLFTHLMVDIEAMGSNPNAPIVSIAAVFFDPATSCIGAQFYQAVSLASSMSFGGQADADTIIWWLKQSSEARAAITGDDAIGLLEAVESLADFIAENSANSSDTVQIWGNGATYDNVILRRAFVQTDTPFPTPFWNDRDVRTIVELGRAVGINPRYAIPFEGEQHNSLADALHQVKYVSAIWQHLTKN
ncbi:Exodeoxyribonuclease VIII-like protein [Enterobacter sp. FY-07]|uniref:exonuclease n=1 Tax=Kosakonia oryzendophytica TaxID=1005665 RepID=UPI0007778340|nr:exonuclease [Kosakonia oryzendophytica]AMO48853.1 Exodeoxyribonuclease VIII-like protein [Enterobacter sp. FY-07]WBT56640.1 3'-5' exoribonuclease [Kosakonia oryzendophytica]